MEQIIHTTRLKELAPALRVSQRILLTGTLYTARDAAHKELARLLDQNQPLPFELSGSAIYYAGPTPTPDNLPIGSCGPTTSGRMDPYTPRFMDLGLVCTIGKGERSAAVYEAIVRNRGVYLCAIGGAGALAAMCVKSCEVIAFEHLGCESIKRLTVENFPLIVAADASGNQIFAKRK